MNLAELQQYFARAATSGSGPLSDLDRIFLGTPRLSASERLAVYNRGYYLRLLDALGSVFSQTKIVLGDADFERLGLTYVAQYPSEHPAVERVGRVFCEYLRSVAAPPAVVDLAGLEWARLCALVAPDPVSLAGVESIDPLRFPTARLCFVPSFRCLELDPMALTLFASTMRPSVDVGASHSALRCGVAVWRGGHAVEHLSLAAEEWHALSQAIAGNELSQVCAAFDTGSGDADVRRAFQVLSGWFARAWLESIAYDETHPGASDAT